MRALFARNSPWQVWQIIGLAFTLGCIALKANDLIKIAVIDLVKVFESHPATADATSQLTKEREASRKTFKEKSNLLKEILQRHQELIRAGKKEEAEKELIKANAAEREIAKLQTTGNRDLEEKFRREKMAIIQSIRKSVAAFNAEAKYAMIFDSSSSSVNGLPQVIHSPGATDITAEVIAFITKESSPDKKNE